MELGARNGMSTATYLYCLVRRDGEPPLDKAPSGLPGCSPPRAVPVDDRLWLVVAGAPLPEFAGESLQERLSDLSWVSDCALAHEAIIEHCGDSEAILPMKLFTLFSSNERALDHVRASRERLDRVLDRVAGHVEWGVRIHLDEARAREVMAEEARGGNGRQGAGTSFLLRKKIEKDASRELAGRLAEEMDAAFAELAAVASEAVRRQPAAAPETGGRLLLDAAFLVPAGRGADFEAVVERCANRLASRACDLTLTGPWPPYHFIEEAR